MTARRYISVPDGGSDPSLAEERGYEPHPDDLLPAPTWTKGGGDWGREMAALRIVGPFTRCSHYACHRSLTEDTVTYCAHDKPFCEDCTWEDSCDECATLSEGIIE